MMKNIFLMLVMMIALTGIAVADTNDTEINDTDAYTIQSQALNVRYDHLQCKVSFTIGQIELFEEYVPDAVNDNLSDSKETLETDMDNLKKYVDDVNKTAFDKYLEDTFRPDFQKATQMLNSIKEDFRQYNVSNETKTELIDELKDIREEYSECVSDKEFKMGTVMERHMENWNRQWGNAIERMKQKGMNTTEIEALIAQINTKNQELNSLIESKNLTNFMKYANEFRQDHLRYAAKIEAEKLKTYKGMLNSESKRYNLSDRNDNIDKHISEIEKYAQKDGKYQEKEFEHAWENVKEANKEMKDLSKDVLKERTRERMHNDSDYEEENEDDENNYEGRGSRR
ncbi:MAG: hypothetical protein ACP5NW_04640 [Candidatus Woesearchaeota archaeon]